MDFLDGSVGKESACNAEDTGGMGSSSGSGRSPGGGHGSPLQYSCLGDPMDRGGWQTTVHRVGKSQTRLSVWACARMCMCIICLGPWGSAELEYGWGWSARRKPRGGTGTQPAQRVTLWASPLSFRSSWVGLGKKAHFCFSSWLLSHIPSPVPTVRLSLATSLEYRCLTMTQQIVPNRVSRKPNVFSENRWKQKQIIRLILSWICLHTPSQKSSFLDIYKMYSFINGLQTAAFCVIQYFTDAFGHGMLSLPLNTYHIAASDICISSGAWSQSLLNYEWHWWEKCEGTRLRGRLTQGLAQPFLLILTALPSCLCQLICEVTPLLRFQDAVSSNWV